MLKMARVKVFITVDTEHSIGGAFRDPNLRPVGNDKRIFGKIGNQFFGIPLIMDIAEAHGIHITFFVEVLNKYYFGEDETKQVCRYILARGHDIQLHLHPTYLNFTQPNPQDLVFSDNMSDYEMEKQIQLIEEGKELLVRYGCEPPIAFRAGNFAADRNTLRGLKENEIYIDSSYNASASKAARKISETEINDLTEFDGVWEFPVTNFIQRIPFIKKRYKALDINAVSFQEIKSVLKKAKWLGQKVVTIILHSFSFIKAYDLQYNDLRPDNTVIKRFQRLCEYLQKRSNHFFPLSFDFLHKQDFLPLHDSTVHTFPKVPSRYSIFSSARQLLKKSI